MSDNVYTVILVYSTSHAMRAEKVLGNSGIKCKLIPVPRQLSSDCGVCVRITRDDRREAERFLREKNVDVEGFHDLI